MCITTGGCEPRGSSVCSMKTFLAATLIMASACGGTTSLDDGDAATAAPAEQRLRTLLPAWCPLICSKLTQCQSPGVDTNCQAQCSQFVTEEYLGQGDACAQLGLDFVNCVDSASCADLASSSNCAPDSSKRSAVCSSYTSDSSQAAPGPDTSAPTVTCQSGGGLATTSPVPVGSLVCDTTRTQCSDGHTYHVACINQGDGIVACSCYLDGLLQTTFPVGGTGCPVSSVVSSYCGWQLSLT